MRILRPLTRSLLHAIPTVLGIVVLNFFLVQLAPGDVADVIAGESGLDSSEAIAQLRRSLGLDQPLLTQLLAYLYNLLHLDLGYSARFNMPILDLILQRLPGTLLLMLTALVIAVLLGMALGAIMSAFAGRWIDRVVAVVSLIFYSVPNFWIGLMLIVFFSVHLGLLPSGGSGSIGVEMSVFQMSLDKLSFMILPATSLALFYVAIYARLTRAAMLEVRSQDYVRTATAKGLSGFTINMKHILRNALIPISTMAGMHLGGMLGGAVVVETVYSWPGLGRLAFEAVVARDFSVLLGILLLSSIVVVAANAAVDVLQAWLDPRIGSSG